MKSSSSFCTFYISKNKSCQTIVSSFEFLISSSVAASFSHLHRSDEWRDDFPTADSEGRYKIGAGTILIPRRDSRLSERLRQYRRCSTDQLAFDSIEEPMDRVSDNRDEPVVTSDDHFSAPVTSVEGKTLGNFADDFDSQCASYYDSVSWGAFRPKLCRTSSTTSAINPGLNRRKMRREWSLETFMSSNSISEQLSSSTTKQSSNKIETSFAGYLSHEVEFDPVLMDDSLKVFSKERPRRKNYSCVVAPQPTSLRPRGFWRSYSTFDLSPFVSQMKALNTNCNSSARLWLDHRWVFYHRLKVSFLRGIVLGGLLGVLTGLIWRYGLF